MANRGKKIHGEVGDPLLSYYDSQSATVLAWCIPPVDDDSWVVDSEFTVNLCYTNHKDGASKASMFKVNREEIRANLVMFGSYVRWGRVVVLDWLKEVGVRWGEEVHLVALDIVVDGFERLLYEVDTRGRKSLYMSVEIEVLAVLSTSGVKLVKVGCGSSMSCQVVGSCAICLEEFEDDTKKSSDGDHKEEEEEVVVVVAVLPCSHMLHQDCLLPWVAKGNRTCPLCRYDMLSVAQVEGESRTV